MPKVYTFAPLLTRRWNNGFLAQLVEQWIENPCVPGSIPGETTRNNNNLLQKPLNPSI